MSKTSYERLSSRSQDTGQDFTDLLGAVTKLNQSLRDELSDLMPVIPTQRTPSKMTLFESYFNRLKNAIEPVVQTVNKKLDKRKLVIVEGKTSGRNFYQICLSYNDRHADVLHDPYLLIEGYPNTNQVRITKSNSEETGNIIDVDKVNDQLITSSMTNFLSSTASSL